MLNGLDLFTGIGGITIALSDWVKPLAYCENDRYAQAVLLSRMADGTMPRAPIWDDIRTLSASSLPAGIDIIYGGFPCQDISLAGTKKGLDGERSGLLWEIVRLTAEIRPSFVFLENVYPGMRPFIPTIRNAFSEFQYDVRDGFIAAKDCGAPHKRTRWFMLAHSYGKGLPLAWRDEKSIEMENRDELEFLVQTEFWSESARDCARVDDGIPPRTHRIKSCGNAVVPIQAREAFKRLCGIK